MQHSKHTRITRVGHRALDHLRTLFTIGIYAIFIIAPFYAPLTVFVASHLQHFDFWRIWKEMGMTIMGLILAGFLATHVKQARKVVIDPLVVLPASYIIYGVIVALYDLSRGLVSDSAIIYGLLLDLRLPAFFLLVLLSMRLGLLGKNLPWKKIVFIPAAMVVLFGLLQMTVLPDDVLKHIGYSAHTIVPFQTVDNRPDFVRIQSTLRGPNPLGAYLLLVITLAAALVLHKVRRLQLSIFMFAATAVLFMTYSRSAYLGLFLSLVATLVVFEKLVTKKRIAFLVLGVLILGCTAVGLRNNYVAQNVVLHSSTKSTSKESSNSQRSHALKSGVEDIIDEPLGGGVGSAGPASLRNTKAPARISENFFLQVGQELGIIGLLLLVAMHLLLLWRLFKVSTSPLALGLFGSLIGLIFVNMLSHAWADDTLTYVWWGLAGVALAPGILKPGNVYGKKQQKTEA